MIPVTLRANFGYLLRHPLQLALALLGIGIGVAVIVAVDLANASARKAFLMSMDAVTGEATHQVIGGPRGIDDTVYVRLRVQQGIRDVAPVVEGTAIVADTAFTVMGVDLFAEQALRSFTGEAQTAGDDATPGESLFRDFLARPGAVTMSQATAREFGLQVGKDFDLRASGRAFGATLIGTFGEDDGTALRNVLVTDIATAQEWLDSVGRLSRIDARIADGDAAAGGHRVSLAGLRAAIGRDRALQAGVESVRHFGLECGHGGRLLLCAGRMTQFAAGAKPDTGACTR
jgi:putative ABC transport system permease protein